MRARQLLAVAAALTAVAATFASATTAGVQRRSAGTVSVLYAGSLVNVMEKKLGPAFERATGYGYRGYGAGSKSVAGQIKGKLRQGDVFISASPGVNGTLMGAGNGDWVTWYAEFASSPLVIGYNPKSHFASDLRSRHWWDVLQEPGFRLGRTDPTVDPKGQLTIWFVRRVQQVLHVPGLFERTLGTDQNTAQIFPEETLLGRLQAGQLDAGFFYSIEAAEAKLATIAPPLGTHYAARYTITILNRAPDRHGALAFVRFLLGPRGVALLRQEGFRLLGGEIGGNAAAVPAGVKALLGAR